MKTFRPSTAFGALSLAAALSLGMAAAAGAQTVLRMSSWAPATSALTTDFLQPWADSVAEVTEGRVVVNILPSALGTPAQHYELARQGIADITWGNLTYEPDRFQAVWFAEMPMTGENGQAASVALWRTFETYFADQPLFAGTRMLGVSLIGGGSLHSSRPIADVDDMVNLKIRMGNPVQFRVVSEFGGVPVAGPATRAYELLDTGVIDASFHPIESIVGFNLADRLTHHTQIEGGFYDAFFFLAINERSWTGISDEDRAAIEAISGETLSATWGRFWDDQNAAAEITLRDMGNTFVTPAQALIDRLAAIRASLLEEWFAAAPGFNLPNAPEIVEYYETTYAEVLRNLE